MHSAIVRKNWATFTFNMKINGKLFQKIIFTILVLTCTRMGNIITHFVNYVLILINIINIIVLTYQSSMNISPLQCHHHHSCHPSPHHSFISLSKCFFFLNPTLHRHLAPLSDWFHGYPISFNGYLFYHAYFIILFYYRPPSFFLVVVFWLFLVALISVSFLIVYVLHCTFILFYFIFYFKHFSSF